MTKVVYKYPIELDDLQKIQMPIKSNILTVKIQDGKLCLWAEVTPEFEIEPVLIKVVGTGHRDFIEEWDQYIGTVQDDRFVWHVYRGQLWTAPSKEIDNATTY